MNTDDWILTGAALIGCGPVLGWIVCVLWRAWKGER